MGTPPEYDLGIRVKRERSGNVFCPFELTLCPTDITPWRPDIMDINPVAGLPAMTWPGDCPVAIAVA